MALFRPFRPTPGSLTSSPLVRGFSSPQLTLEYREASPCTGVLERLLQSPAHPAPSPDLLGVVPVTHPVSDVKESKPEDPAPPSSGRHAALQSQPAHGFYVAIRPESTAAGSGVLATWAREPLVLANWLLCFVYISKGMRFGEGYCTSTCSLPTLDWLELSWCLREYSGGKGILTSHLWLASWTASPGHVGPPWVGSFLTQNSP